MRHVLKIEKDDKGKWLIRCTCGWMAGKLATRGLAHSAGEVHYERILEGMK